MDTGENRSTPGCRNEFHTCTKCLDCFEGAVFCMRAGGKTIRSNSLPAVAWGVEMGSKFLTVFTIMTVIDEAGSC